MLDDGALAVQLAEVGTVVENKGSIIIMDFISRPYGVCCQGIMY